jgi:hypothetical protein
MSTVIKLTGNVKNVEWTVFCIFALVNVKYKSLEKWHEFRGDTNLFC